MAEQLRRKCFGDPERDKFLTILKNVSFTCEGGQLLGILGASGSGKTTLLNILASRHTGGALTGDVLCNGSVFEGAEAKLSSAYVMQVRSCFRVERKASNVVTQDDRLLPNLSVRETLRFVAELKLPADMTHEHKMERVSRAAVRFCATSVLKSIVTRSNT